MTKEFLGDEKGNLRAVVLLDVKLTGKGIEIIEGSEREIPAQLAILAMGFLHPEQQLVKVSYPLQGLN